MIKVSHWFVCFIRHEWARPDLKSTIIVTMTSFIESIFKTSSTIAKSLTWQCGWGLEHPMTLPLFSKICTQRYFSPSSCSCSVQVAITRRISSSFIRGRVRSECGWKHITRQVPWAGAVLSSGWSDWSVQIMWFNDYLAISQQVSAESIQPSYLEQGCQAAMLRSH